MPQTSPTAVVFGANGQDGRYLTASLIRRGYRVVGASRQATAAAPSTSTLFAYRQLDLADQIATAALLEQEAPDLIFHAAAIHASAAKSSGTTYEGRWPEMAAVNINSAQTALEYLRTTKPAGKLLYISSGKVFGPNYPSLVDERSPRQPLCLYTISKIAAENIVNYYRMTHGVRSNIVYTFGHESPLRPSDFFIPKVARALRNADEGNGEVVEMHTLDFFSNWGAAPEYMDICVDIAEADGSQDFVLGSRTWLGREFVRQLFERNGHDYRRHISERVTQQVSPTSGFEVSQSLLEQSIGRKPEVDFLNYVGEISLTI